jgi:hypothetical protein
MPVQARFWNQLAFIGKILAVLATLSTGIGWAMLLQERVAKVEVRVEMDSAALQEIKSGVDKVNERIDAYLLEVRNDAQRASASR